MDAHLRGVLGVFEFKDESLESIAKGLGITGNTVHARLAEAKRIFGIRVRKLLNDERRSSMFVPLFVGADALSDADLQTPAFVEEMRARIWNGIANELGFSPASPAPKSSNVLRRILGNRGVIAITSAGAGFIAALLWPRDVPAVAKHVTTAAPVIVVQNSESPQTAEIVEPSLAIASAAPTLVKSTAPNVPTGPKVHVDHELRTLEEARKFIASERYAEAIAALTRHQRQFPQSDFAAIRSRYMALAQEGQRQTLARTTP